MVETKSIKIHYIFCDSTNFEIPYEGYSPYDNEEIQCSNCGNINIFSDIKNIAINQGINSIKKGIEQKFKKLFK